VTEELRILIVTDAWHPQVNGVVRTLDRTCLELRALGHVVEVVGPDRFRTLPCPTYPEIRLALVGAGRLAALIDEFAPDAIHIATEGPLGHAARRACLRRGWPFTTAFHTSFPEYLKAHIALPLDWSYAYLRAFHARAEGTMVATVSLARALARHGFARLRFWSRGVDTEKFRPGRKDSLEGERPILLYAGRVAIEKNLDAFLALDIPGTKYVVGTGPDLAALRRRYPRVRFAGYLDNGALVAHYAAADVFVFPSRTDTFGLVILEALACGVPVAAYPVTGPLDVIADSGAGALDEDLRRAIHRALAIPPERCRAHALKFSWRACAQQFLANLAPIGRQRRQPILFEGVPSR
jgi:glycosyltransferase involved in cell wall biosynthesis